MKWRISKENFEPDKDLTVNSFDDERNQVRNSHLTGMAMVKTCPPEEFGASDVSNPITKNVHNRYQIRRHNQRMLPLEDIFIADNASHGTHDSAGGEELFVISNSHQRSIEQPPPPLHTNKTLKTSIGTQTSQLTTIKNETDVGNLRTIIMLENYPAPRNNNEFRYMNETCLTPATTVTNPSSAGSLNKRNCSQTKLLSLISSEDQSTKQSKCSILHGLILCLCLNMTYANVVRFPRELERHGSAFLVPYFIILFLVGLPIILLEVSIGQFLGQGAANSWRVSPIFKGACVIGRLASCLNSLWVSLHASLAIVYIGMLAFKTVPFSICGGGVKIAQIGYESYGIGGQDCIKRTFLTPVWQDTLYFTFLVMSLIFFWIITMPWTHNSKVFRRSVLTLGLFGFILFCFLTSWEVHKSLQVHYFPRIWSFEINQFIDSPLWFDALVQVIMSTNIGFGSISVITGKFLYKGDAVRTTLIYLCFNLLVSAITVTLFMTQYDNPITLNTSTIHYPELKPLTALYDNVLTREGDIATRILPGFLYLLIVITAMMTAIISIYTASRLIPRHPNYILSLLALVVGIAALVCNEFSIPRILDSRLVGTLIICSICFDLFATVWVYGAKNIYTDLEFSIGRPIFKSWIALWCFAPIISTAILVWWSVEDDFDDLLHTILPRWGPFLFVLAVILLIAGIEVYKQVDYNFFGMICEAAKPEKQWGPEDPMHRHAWKLWRSVCQEEGRKDFSLRRRGTKHYTNSIKKGQYSTSKVESSSPNYSGSIFGDSAIEEDISVGRYSGGGRHDHDQNDGQVARYYSNRPKKQSHEKINRQNSPITDKGKPKSNVLYIRRLSVDKDKISTEIEMSPSSETKTSRSSGNPPIARQSNASKESIVHSRNASNTQVRSLRQIEAADAGTAGDHICWRKFSVNSEEYSTEL